MLIAALILAVVVVVWAVIDKAWSLALLGIAVALIAVHALPWGIG